MNYKPDEATLISYLYGELDGETQKQVENYLRSNPEEKKRMEEWSFTRTALGHLQDKEVIAPPIILGDEVHRQPFWKENYFRMPLGIAASLLFLLVVAKMLDLSASYAPGELKIGFGVREKPAPTTPPLNEQQVANMIHHSVASNNEVLRASWGDDRKLLEQSIQNNLSSNSRKIDMLVQAASSANQEQVRDFVTHLQNDNLKLMKDYMQLSSAGQKEYIENLLLDFSKYLQEQRNQDLQLFQARMNRVEENTDQFKQETEQILTSLISNGPTNQKRN